MNDTNTKSDTAWSQDRIELMKRTICPKGIGEDEFALFVEQCKQSGLDPLLKEAFCVPRKLNVGSRERPQWINRYEFQPSEAGMLSRAERFPDFRGISAQAVFAGDDIVVDSGEGLVHHKFNPTQRKGALLGAWARVVRDGKTPTVVWLDLAGYIQDSALWRKIPATMMEKCARVAALRKAYPSAFGGLYIREEMPAEEFSEQAAAPAQTDGHASSAAMDGVLFSGKRTHAVKAELAHRVARVREDKPAEARQEVKVEGPAKALAAEIAAAVAPGPEVAKASAPAPKAEVARTEPVPVEARPSAPKQEPLLPTIGFGPQKGMPISTLTEDQLKSAIDFARADLADHPRSPYAKKMRSNLAALSSEQVRRNSEGGEA